MPPVNAYLRQFIHKAKKGRALDIAAGMGQNALYLAKMGFVVDAVDISRVGLSNIERVHNINIFNCDINKFTMAKNSYQLILNLNFLERGIFGNIVDALCEGGVLFFQSFTQKSSMNRAYCLEKNELLEHFCELDILYYELFDEEQKVFMLARKG